MGKFVDRERPTFLDTYHMVNEHEIGDWPTIEHYTTMLQKEQTGT